jgi:hypothetical protein
MLQHNTTELGLLGKARQAELWSAANVDKNARLLGWSSTRAKTAVTQAPDRITQIASATATAALLVLAIAAS